MVRMLHILPLALLGACAASADVGANPSPALWKLSDPDTTIYLFGTVHALPASMTWSNAKVDRAVAGADTLVLEVDTGEAARSAQAIFARLGRTSGLPPVAERIGPALRPALAHILTKTGIDPVALDGLESWAAALTIAAGQLRTTGASTGAGVEAQLTARFAAAGKPVIALESTAEQLGFFDALPEDAQRRFLEQVIRDASGDDGDFTAMTQAWLAGDLSGIQNSLGKEMQLSPALIDPLLTDRNRRWAGWIEKRLAVPGTTLVAVGAGHFTGADGLPELLAARKLKIERVQ